MSNEFKAQRERPVWVWLISIYFFLSAIWSLLSLYLILSGTIPLEPAQKAYFDRQTPVDYALIILAGLLNLAGAVTLFLLRKIARYLFLSALGLLAVSTLWHAAAKGWIEASGVAGFVGVLIGYALLVIVCIYAWRLSKKGVLQ